MTAVPDEICDYKSTDTFTITSDFGGTKELEPLLECGGGRYQILFKDLNDPTLSYPEIIVYHVGMSPVGAYNDYIYCYYWDGFEAYNFTITNIVVTA